MRTKRIGKILWVLRSAIIYQDPELAKCRDPCNATMSRTIFPRSGDNLDNLPRSGNELEHIRNDKGLID